MPLNIFAETYETDKGEIKTTDWEPTEENLKGKNFWPLGNKQYLREVSRVSEVMKNPILHYEGYFTRPDGRTVIRLTMRKFDKVGSGVWHVMQMKLEDSLFEKIDWQDTQTGIYKGVSKNAADGWYHDDIAYEKITPFGDTNIINAGTTNVKEINISNNNNTASGPATNEVPINLVLKDEFNIHSFDHEPLAQMRLLDKSKTQIAAYTGGKKDLANYSSYTFSSILPLKNNYKQNLLRERRSNNTSIRFMKGSNSSIYYNKEKGYIEVTQYYNKSSLPKNTYYGANLGYRQTVDKKFFDVLKPIDTDGTIAHIYSISNNGLPTSGRLDKAGNPTSSGAVPVLKRNINFPEGSDTGFIQIANTDFYREQEAQEGIKTNTTTLQPLDSWFDGIESLLNGGQGTVVRYYVDNEKVEKWLNQSDDGLSFAPFYSSVIRDNEEGFSKYEFTLNEDQELKSGDTINIEFEKAYGKGTGSNAQGTDGLKTMTMFFTVKGEGNDMYLGTNFYHMGYGVIGAKDNGMKYEYRIQNGMPMNLKKGTKITLYTVFDTGGDAVFKFNNSQTVQYPAKMQKDHSPIEFEWQGTLSAGTIALTYFKPDVDEIFLGDEHITGRTLYENGEVNIKKHAADKDSQTIIAKPGDTSNKDDSRIEVEVNGKKQLGYEFDTKKPGMKKDGKTVRTFKMPDLERDMPILFTNTNVQNLAEESRPPVIEQVQTKFHFDLSGQISRIDGREVIDKVAPLSKEYKYDPETGQANANYKVSGFAKINKEGKVEGAENLKLDNKNQIVSVKQKLTDAQQTIEIDRNVINYIDHDGGVYDINNTDQKIKNDQVEKLLMRQFPTNEEVNLPNAKKIIGWTTVKLEDIKDSKGNVTKTAEEQYYDLLNDKAANGKPKKLITDVKTWEKVDADAANPGAQRDIYIFDELSPIDKERTVYAVYGGLSLVLHSNNKDNLAKENIVRIPITQEDINTTGEKMKGIDESEIANRIKSEIIKALPKAPYTETDKSGSDERLADFTKEDQTFLGWNTVRDNPEFKAGNNNNRISELDKGKDVDGKHLIKSTEWIDNIRENQDKAYLPNGFNLGIKASDFDKDGNLITDKNNTQTETLKTLEELLAKGKDIHLYAMYRPYYKITANPGYFKVKAADTAHADGVLEPGLKDKAKEQALLIGLMTRTAVTGYDKPTVSANANYFPIFDPSVVDENIDNLEEADLIKKLKLKKWDPSKNNNTQDLTWTEPGFDVLGRRKSYVALVVTDKNKEAYKEFAKPFVPGSWADVGISTFLKLGGTSLDPNAPKNLYDNEADPYKATRDGYGKPLAKLQTFQLEALDESGQPKKDSNDNKIVDAFTSATSRASILDDKTGEVVGYNVVITNILANLPAPEFDRVVDTHKEVKLKWEDSDKYNEITRIEIYAYDNPKATKTKTYTLEKTEDGEFSGNGLKAEFDSTSGRLKIKAEKSTTDPFPNDALPLVAGKDLAAKYFVVEKATEAGKADKIIKQSYIGNTRIIGDKLSEPVRDMSQGEKENPNDKAYIKFTVPEKDLDKVGPNSVYIAEKWTDGKWVKVGQRRLTAADRENGQLENNKYDIELEEYTGAQGEDDFVQKQVTDADGITTNETFYKVKHGDIIRIVSVEANKDNDVVNDNGVVEKTGYSNPAYSAGRDLKARTDYPEYEENDRAIKTSEIEDRNYIKLDLEAPIVSDAKATEDEAFRRFIDIKGQLDEIPNNSRVTIEFVDDNGQPAQGYESITFETKELAIRYINRISRDENMPIMRIIAKDSKGNQSTTEVEYNKTYQCSVEVTNPRVGRPFIAVKSDMAGVKIVIEVYRNGTKVAVGSETTTAADTIARLDFKKFKDGAVTTEAYRLQEGDVLEIKGSVTKEGKLYTTNPLSIEVED